MDFFVVSHGSLCPLLPFFLLFVPLVLLCSHAQRKGKGKEEEGKVSTTDGPNPVATLRYVNTIHAINYQLIISTQLHSYALRSDSTLRNTILTIESMIKLLHNSPY